MPYTPEQNGVIERENKILVEAARSMLHAKDLPDKLWAEAVNMAAYVLNRTEPTPEAGKSPYEIWFKRKPSVDHLKIFGSECFTHIPKQKRRKFDKNAIKG
ncbi:Retrovirus-related Pol polyprotein from transposon TNT 1-94 [Araneus ventricosus]|uniref:Retrovirus-related Pol polyprotein from transposon TNT 1-94 n=1 Tax=Araneus ventricosus TaxID=182803 RepID=A0A4Y2NG21_ARAVE|nr:Retrovirus-related Pol polyprotein from transposon TNT 1-94 [Araneus ventricosus]